MNGTSSQTGDCDDLDPFTFPGSAENDSATSCMRDADGDGYGELTRPIVALPLEQTVMTHCHAVNP